jgi:hypothetical protein
LVGMAALNALMLWRARSEIAQGYGDFASFYTAGKIVQRGQASQLYDRRLQWHVQQEFAPEVRTRRGPLPYIRPPFEALLFLPLAYLKFAPAHLLWSILNVMGLFLFLFLLPRDLGDENHLYALDLLVCAAFFPLAYDLLAGQDAILLLLVMVIALRSLLAGKDFLTGMVLGLGLFKFNLLIPVFLVFLLRKKLRVFGGLMVTACVLLLISVAVVGPAALVGYPKYLWDLDHVVGVGVITAETMPNVRGLLVPLLGTRTISNLLHLFLAAVVLAGVAVTAHIWRTDNSDRNPRVTMAGFSLLIVVTLVTSYYANSYDLTLLLIPIFLLSRDFAAAQLIRGWPRTLFLSCVALLLFSAVWWVIALPINQFFWMGWVLLVFAVALGRTVQIWQHQRSKL